MNVSIAGQHINIGESLQEYAKGKITDMVTRYFEHATSAAVHFTKQAHKGFICDIIVHEGSGRHIVIKSDAVCDEIYSSFDLALAKAEKRLRKYKSKLNDRSHKIKLAEADMTAVKYIFASHHEPHDDEHSVPVTIAEQPVDIMKLSVGDALMKMELENLPALMFKNSKTDRMNVVYHRPDGNISWVDSR